MTSAPLVKSNTCDKTYFSPVLYHPVFLDKKTALDIFFHCFYISTADTTLDTEIPLKGPVCNQQGSL